MTDLSPLLRPLTLRGLVLANRIVMAPMTRNRSPNNTPGEEVAGYYRRRAENGIGLILTEGAGVAHPAAIDAGDIPHMHGDAPLAGWRRVFDAVHAAGCPIIPQLWHQGVMRDAALSPDPSVASVRPSGIWGPAGGIVSLDQAVVARLSVETRPMDAAEIDAVIAAHARSARDAVACGADGIALHAGHGYLIDSFLWHETNRRDDRWGGGPAERARFAAAVVSAVRSEIGEQRPIFFRFSQFKMQNYKAALADTPAELERMLAPIAEAGVDVFDASQRFFDTPAFPGSPLNLAGWARKLTGRASMTVGGVGLDQGRRAHHVDSGPNASDNLERVAERLARGEFDLVAVGRSLLNDPAWFARVRRGEAFLPFNDESLRILT